MAGLGRPHQLAYVITTRAAATTKARMMHGRHLALPRALDLTLGSEKSAGARHHPHGPVRGGRGQAGVRSSARGRVRVLCVCRRVVAVVDGQALMGARLEEAAPVATKQHQLVQHMARTSWWQGGLAPCTRPQHDTCMSRESEGTYLARIRSLE